MKNKKAIYTLFIAISMVFEISSSFAQSITQDPPFEVFSLQKAVDSCLTKNPIIKNAKDNISFIENNKSGGLKHKPIEFYQKAELSTPFNIEYNFDIRNDSKLPFVSFNKKTIFEKELEIAKVQHKILSVQLIENVKSAYNQLVYCHNKLSLLNELKKDFEDLIRVSNLHYDQGETDELEKKGVQLLFEEVQYRYKIALNDVVIAQNNLQMLIMDDEDIVPNTKESSMFVIKSSDDKLNRFGGNLLIDYYIKKCELEDLSSKKETLAKTKANNELIYQKYLITNKVDILNKELKNKLIKLSYYDGSALPYADELIKNSDLKLKKEDISYLEWLQDINRAIQIKLEYLDALNEYNQTAIKLELYTY